MLGRVVSWSLGLLVLACLGPAVARASDAMSEAPAGDLSARVQTLEDALQKANAKAQAEQRKAAGLPSVEFGGRMYFDHVFNGQDTLNRQVYGNAADGVEFRTLRLKTQGKAAANVDYKAELDFAKSSATMVKDVYLGVSELPVLGNVRAGHFTEPIGLEGPTSTNFMTFIERNAGREAFLPIRDTGVMLFIWTESQRVTWQAGMFDTDIGDSPATRIADELAQSFTGRVTWLPWYDECTEGRGLLHTGAAYSYRHPYHQARTLSTLVDEHIGIAYINTGPLSLNDYQLFALEAATVYGPLSVQSESFVVRADPTMADASEMTFHSCYVTVSYFLTGEHRRYRRDLAVFDRIKPFEDFFRVQAEDGQVYTGLGAWEVAFRYDYIDVGDAGPSAGMCAAQTYGVNWYLNPYTRVMWNYVHANPHRDHTAAGSLDAFQMWFQIDF